MKFKKKKVLAGLNISTVQRTMSGEKSSYARQSCVTKDTFVQRELNFLKIYQCLKTQNHSVRKSLSCSGLSFHEHFNRKTYLYRFF